MPGKNREQKRRNALAKELASPLYGPRIREVKKHYMIDRLHEQEADEDIYDYLKDLGLTTRE